MAKASPPREETEEEAIERLAVLFKESDRGCALVGGAILDEALADLLRAALAPDTDANLFGQDSVLGAFSSRIKLAKAIGLINATDFHDLDLVRKIRNDAAHFAKERGFATGFSTDATTDR
jgi:DNA-binding MltR family transcriptional regulator